MEESGQAEAREEQENDNLQRGDDIPGRACLRGSPVVDIHEEGHGRHGQRFGKPVSSRGGHQPRGQLLENPREVGPEAQGVKTAGYGVREPRHPAAQKAVGLREGRLDPEVASASLGKGRTQLGVGHGRDDGGQAVQGEGEDEAGPGGVGGQAGENEYPGPDHGPDADHRDREQGHRSRQVVTGGRVDRERTLALSVAGGHLTHPFAAF